MLETANFKVYSAKTMRHAIDLIKKPLSVQAEIDLIVVDIYNHKIETMELMENIKVILPNIPIIIITGLLDEKVAGRLTKYHSIKIITKPIQERYLIQTINKLLKNK